jgi:hypothetical protein
MQPYLPAGKSLVAPTDDAKMKTFKDVRAIVCDNNLNIFDPIGFVDF